MIVDFFSWQEPLKPLQTWLFNTKENPADIITGTNEMNVINVINDMTYLEPPFLCQISEIWDHNLEWNHNDSQCLSEWGSIFHEQDDDTYVLIATDGTPSIGNLIDIVTYDASFKLLRITALILKFVHNIHQRMRERMSAISL